MTSDRNKHRNQMAQPGSLGGPLRGQALPPGREIVPSGIPIADPESVALSPVALQRAGEALRREIERGQLPGAVALVARHGRIAWFEAFGKLGPEGDEPMRCDSIFRIYSMTKPVVSLAVTMLMEAGRLTLADPLAQYLPEFASPKVARHDGPSGGPMRLDPVLRPITLQDLLRHTSGITYEFLGAGPVHRAYREARLGDPRRSNAQMCELLATLPLLHAPGERWGYGHSTDVLGRVVEVVSGQPLGSFLRERIFEPLGMVDTAFHVPPDEQHRIAEPFSVDPDSGESVKLLDPCRPPALEMGGGGLMSTAADYARFVQMLIGGGRFGGTRLIGRKTIELMSADHLGTIPVSSPLLSPGHGFGLGFAVRTLPGVATAPGSVGQYFWSGIAGTTFWVDPREDLFAILMIQAPGQRVRLRQIFRSLVYAAIDV